MGLLLLQNVMLADIRYPYTKFATFHPKLIILKTLCMLYMYKLFKMYKSCFYYSGGNILLFLFFGFFFFWGGGNGVVSVYLPCGRKHVNEWLTWSLMCLSRNTATQRIRDREDLQSHPDAANLFLASNAYRYGIVWSAACFASAET